MCNGANTMRKQLPKLLIDVRCNMLVWLHAWNPVYIHDSILFYYSSIQGFMPHAVDVVHRRCPPDATVTLYFDTGTHKQSVMPLLACLIASDTDIAAAPLWSGGGQIVTGRAILSHRLRRLCNGGREICIWGEYL